MMRYPVGSKKADKRFFLLSLMVLTLFFAIGALATARAETSSKALSIGGGPMGGTFRHIAAAMAEFVTKSYADIEMFSETSGGSLENIRRLSSVEFDFAIAYAGDIALAASGKLPHDTKRYDKVQPIGYLYGAPAQLVIRSDSGIHTCKDLAGKKVAVGNPGSGAALAAERFFKHLKVWDRSQNLYLGYDTAARAFNLGRIDAFWVLVGFPNAAVKKAANHQTIALVPVGKEAEASGFKKAYSFYTNVTIPAGTYPGVDVDSLSFQDSALLCVRAGVSDDVVYKVTRAIWSTEGLAHLGKAHKAAKSMKVANGVTGIPVKLAKGAAQFWRDHNIAIPNAIRPD